MITYTAEEARMLSQRNTPFEQDKKDIMNKICLAISKGKTRVLVDKRPMGRHISIVSWLVGLGYRCVSTYGDDKMLIIWE